MILSSRCCPKMCGRVCRNLQVFIFPKGVCPLTPSVGQLGSTSPYASARDSASPLITDLGPGRLLPAWPGERPGNGSLAAVRPHDSDQGALSLAAVCWGSAPKGPTWGHSTRVWWLQWPQWLIFQRCNRLKSLIPSALIRVGGAPGWGIAFAAPRESPWPTCKSPAWKQKGEKLPSRQAHRRQAAFFFILVCLSPRLALLSPPASLLHRL